MFNSWNNYNTNSNFNSIKDLVRDGLSEMRKNPSNDSFKIWFDYSYKILTLSIDKQQITYDYMTLGQTLNYTNIQPYEKFGRCIDFLLEIMKYV